MEILKLEVENNLSGGHFQEQGENVAQEERQDAPWRLRLTEWELKRVSAGHQRLNRELIKLLHLEQEWKMSFLPGKYIWSLFPPCVFNFIFIWEGIDKTWAEKVRRSSRYTNKW